MLKIQKGVPIRSNLSGTIKILDSFFLSFAIFEAYIWRQLMPFPACYEPLSKVRFKPKLYFKTCFQPNVLQFCLNILELSHQVNSVAKLLGHSGLTIVYSKKMAEK